MSKQRNANNGETNLLTLNSRGNALRTAAERGSSIPTSMEHRTLQNSSRRWLYPTECCKIPRTTRFSLLFWIGFQAPPIAPYLANQRRHASPAFHGPMATGHGHAYARPPVALRHCVIAVYVYTDCWLAARVHKGKMHSISLLKSGIEILSVKWLKFTARCLTGATTHVAGGTGRKRGRKRPY
jgi:hypothetical protein